MAKTKISEWSATSADNTDISNINIAEGCSPANVNNAIRTVMAQVKDLQAGTSGDTIPITAGGTGQTTASLAINALVPSQTSNTGKFLTTNGSAVSWGTSFVSGMIMMWSGTIATIPTGWVLCNGSNSTPDLRNRFIVGAYSDTTGVAYTTITGANTQTGGSKDAITVSHTHTGTTDSKSLTGTVANIAESFNSSGTASGVFTKGSGTSSGTPTSTDTSASGSFSMDASHTHTFTTGSTGSSGTDANLVPYFALAFIMKT
jgi:hypothetical protein